jgi:hypothetical protein
MIWLEPQWADKLAAMRQPGESYSDVIVRLAAESSDRPAGCAASSTDAQ